MWDRRLACLPEPSKHVLDCRTSSRLARCLSHASGKVSAAIPREQEKAPAHPGLLSLSRS